MVKVVADAELWTLAQAVAYFCLPHGEPDGERQKIAAAVLAGKHSKALGEAELAALAVFAQRARDRMERDRLGADHQMLTALWIKFLHELDAPFHPDGIRELKESRIAARGKPMLYQLLIENRGSPMWVGPRTAAPGFLEADGFAFEELLLSKFEPSPYSSQWRMIELQPSEPRPRRAGTSERTEAAAASRTRRELRSTEDYKAVYGKKLVDALGAVCADELAKAEHGLLRKGGKDKQRRPYASDMSLAALAEQLKRRHHVLSDYSTSTLRATLPKFVACPRGRPASKPAAP